MTRIAVHGTGRMGRAIVQAADERRDAEVVSLVGPKAPDWDSRPPWVTELDSLPDAPDLLIDFTLPDGTGAAAAWCADRGVPLLSGVTGLPGNVHQALRKAAERVPVLWSPNLSLGVNLLAELAGQAAGMLDAETPVTIEDIHHQWKKDAPSGTALMLGEAIASRRGGDGGDIEYRSERRGEVIGDHTVTFQLNGEEFDLVHRAGDRAIFARGALDAGVWLTGRPPGFYAARDWLFGR
ncbi:MAG: 4-hydroxy-tetrahydrodipicolinate reductase [Xanthomonadales bacterium]|nr:4-hydroxy-tetrahydrodipicolinate reductase [Xanthomonadales bacterium]